MLNRGRFDNTTLLKSAGFRLTRLHWRLLKRPPFYRETHNYTLSYWILLSGSYLFVWQGNYAQY